MNIVIPDDYQHAARTLEAMRLLDGHRVTVLGDLARDRQADVALAEADAVVLIRERTRIDAGFLRRTPRLKCISQTGRIAGHIDRAACAAAGVTIVEGIGSPVAPAELTWTLIMAARRKLVPAVDGLRAGHWQTNMGEALHGRTLGIWGYGKIGRLVAGYGRAFAMPVLVWGGEASRAAAVADGHSAAAERDELFETADVLSLHLRLVEATRGIVTASDLARMKPGALLVNTSRAELVETGALEAALAAGRPGFAAIDVFEREPVHDPRHPLLRLPNVLATPHLGYVEKDSYEIYFASAFANLVAFFSGHPTNVVAP